MSNETFWAIKRRQRAAAAAKKAPPVQVVVEAPPEPDEDEDAVSYRDLQEQAKELDIPANQSREDLEAAIAEALED